MVHKDIFLTIAVILTLWFPGREYETRNYSFEEVNHHMAEQLAMVGSVAILLYSVLRLVEYH